MKRQIRVSDLRTEDVCKVIGGRVDPLTGTCKTKIEDGELHVRVLEVPNGKLAIQVSEMENGTAEEISTYFLDPVNDVCEIVENEFGKSLYCYDMTKYYRFANIRLKEDNTIEVDISDESLHVQGWYKKV